MGIARQINAALRSWGPAIGTLAENAGLLLGAGLITYGASLAYPPAGPIVGGALLIAGVLLQARGKG